MGTPIMREVIHCGDCKHWCPGYIVDTAELEYFVTPKCGKYEQMVGHSSDDYCSLAERKEEGK